MKSHIHPKFVIVNAGGKLQKLCGEDLMKVLLDFPILRVVMEVYTAWVRPANLKDKSFNVAPVPLLNLIGGDSTGDDDNDDYNDSDYDNRTTPYRLYPQNRKTQNSLQGSPVRKRKCIEPPQASGSERKVLSELSLFKHDQQSGARLWTGNRICKWDQENRGLVANNRTKKVCT
jgi:hypothetical protein